MEDKLIDYLKEFITKQSSVDVIEILDNIENDKKLKKLPESEKHSLAISIARERRALFDENKQEEVKERIIRSNKAIERNMPLIDVVYSVGLSLLFFFTGILYILLSLMYAIEALYNSVALFPVFKFACVMAVIIIIMFAIAVKLAKNGKTYYITWLSNHDIQLNS